ncbi:carboxypeptidase regulatory-like domain-containing protein [Shewanella sp. Scap07]|uniref:DUF6795 domain-containing protein n=1 Tax=Shewanella sp. Scap07 TaxID=2589987 RepID=UPI0015BE0963|nr:DUF6795 domain-containing protein [Shewanella sp. Scap07]QLE87147.1 carboxypeptidase regulatory-like domain-containing protein [Shewanella sp. Scap07]
MFGLFEKAVDVAVFPSVSGRVLNNGEPISNFKLRRGYLYLGTEEEQPVWDEAYTDEQGNFQFPELIIQSKLPNIPFGRTIIAQLIDIQDTRYPEYKDTYLWWAKSKGVNHISHFVERLAALNCDLNDEEVPHQIINEKYEGAIRYEVKSICRWPELEAIEVEKREKYGEW